MAARDLSSTQLSSVFCSLIWVELPLLDVHHPLPDGVPHDVLLDPGQHREWRVLIRKALKQHPRHLPPLYPVTIRKIISHHTCFCKRFSVLKIETFLYLLLCSLLCLASNNISRYSGLSLREKHNISQVFFFNLRPISSC